MWDTHGIESDRLGVLDRNNLPRTPPGPSAAAWSGLQGETKYGYEAGIPGEDAVDAIEKFQERKAKEVAALLVDAGIERLFFVEIDSDLVNGILRSICEKLFAIMAKQAAKITLTKHPIASVFGTSKLMEAISKQLGKSVDETYENINAHVPYLLEQYNAYVEIYNRERRWTTRKPWLSGVTHDYFKNQRRGKLGDSKMPESTLENSRGGAGGPTGLADEEDAIKGLLKDPRMMRGGNYGPLAQSLIVGRAAEFLGGTRRRRRRRSRSRRSASGSKSRRRKPSGPRSRRR